MIYSAQVISERAVYYNISVKDLDSICLKENKSKVLLYERARNGLEKLTKKLILIRNSLFALVDENGIIEGKINKLQIIHNFEIEK